ALFSLGFTEEAEEIALAERIRVCGQVASMPEHRAHQYLHGDPSRSLLTPDSADLESEGMRLNFPRYLMGFSDQETPQESRPPELLGLTRIQELCEEADPVLRNLWITHSYHVLSRAIAGAVDQQNVNWSTF